jgi:TolB-like protein
MNLLYKYYGKTVYTDKEATMRKYASGYISFIILFFSMLQVPSAFSFETSPPSYLEPKRFEDPVEKSEYACGLITQIRKLAGELFSNLNDPDPEMGDLGDGMLVTTFVDINKLYRSSSFGRYLTEQVMNEFQSHSYRVIDIRKSLSVMVQEKRGEFGMSRDPEEIGTSATAGAMLAGTYLVGKDGIIVNARILNNESSVLLSSATIIFERNEFTEKMLEDASSAKTESSEVSYLKKLER